MSLKARVDSIYNNMVSSLVAIADKIIPKRKVNFLKYWWNEAGNLLKMIPLRHIGYGLKMVGPI